MLGHRGRHHGHHHHHGGGGYWRGGGRWDWGPYYAQPQVIVVETQPACPDTWAPVVATDGRIYKNECIARRRGTVPVRAATGAELAKTQPLGESMMGSKLLLAASALGVGIVGGFIGRAIAKRRK